jgi:hypothetical protein
MITTIYVALRLDHRQVSVDKDRNLGVETLGYTDRIADGKQMIETIAAKDIHGRDWSYEMHGDPFYDPLDDEAPTPEPGSKFGVWDEDLEPDDPMIDRPTTVVASISVYSEERPHRALLRSYRLCRTNPTVPDFVRATSEGDLEMQRQIATGESTL